MKVGSNLIDLKKKMKLIHIVFVLTPLLFWACDDDDAVGIVDEIAGLEKAQELVNDTHTLELYTATGKFQTGYNEIKIKIKENETETYLEKVVFNWLPLKQAPTAQYSCPRTDVRKGNGAVYRGSLVFQDTGVDGEGWSLKFTYFVDTVGYEIEEAIIVEQSKNKNLAIVTGSDNVEYILALVEPTAPKVGANKMNVELYSVQTRILYSKVADFLIKSSPQLAGEENPALPSNTDLVYDKGEEIYIGEMALTMAGSWRLNLQLIDAQGVLLAGEPITEDGPTSSLYFDLEF